MFIKEVRAQEADIAKTQDGFSFTGFVPLILIFVVFYFFIIRPQSKKIKEHKSLVDSLKIGDKIITNSGIMGIIKEIDSKENILEIEIAENVQIKILRNFVSDLAKKEESKKGKNIAKDKKSKK